MDLKKLKRRIKAHLRAGSLNVPGKSATYVLASELKVHESILRKVLYELEREGVLDLGSGTLTHTSYIGLKNQTPFIAETPEARRQHKYARDQRGYGYSGTTTGGPITERHCTLEEWINAGCAADAYPFQTPPEPPEEQETTMDAQAPSDARPNPEPKARKTREATKPRETKLTEARQAKLEQLKQIIIGEIEKAENDHVLTVELTKLAAELLPASPNMVSSYLTELRRAGFCDSFKLVFHGESYTSLIQKLDVDARTVKVLELLRELSRKRKRGTLKQEVSKLIGCSEHVAEVTYLRPLSKVGAYRTERRPQTKEKPQWSFKLAYVQDGPLTEEQMKEIRAIRSARTPRQPKVVQVTPDLVEPIKAATATQLVVNPVKVQKFNAVLELLRMLQGQAERRALTVEVSELLGVTERAAQNSFLSQLFAVGAYRTEQDKASRLRKLVYVQDGPLSPEQLAEISEYVRGQRPSGRAEKATSGTDVGQAEAVLVPAEAQVVASVVEPDEITQLITELIETNEALKAELERERDIRSALERSIADLQERLQLDEIMLEAERARAVVQAPPKPLVPSELLERARSLVRPERSPSSATS